MGICQQVKSIKFATVPVTVAFLCIWRTTVFAIHAKDTQKVGSHKDIE